MGQDEEKSKTAIPDLRGDDAMKTKILIVDDLPENIKALTELIRGEGVEVRSALNADEALNLILDHDFALALVDVQMPTMSGFELARLIRGVSRGRHLPIIFVTAQRIEARVIFEGYETGAVDILFKPLDPNIVRSKVRVFVRLDQQSRLLQTQVETMSRLKKDAEAANIAKSRFLATISHEIRTPLGAVLGFADILAQNGLTAQERAESLSAISRNGQLLLRLIGDVLDLTAVEAEKLELEAIPFSLPQLLDDLRATFTVKADEKGLQFAIDSDFNELGRFVSDPYRLQQILMNVIGNAFKFTDRGFVKIKVAVGSPESGSSLRTIRFLIEDSGIGVKAEELTRLFQPFVQADSSTRRRFGGTGLGLVLSRQLAKALGGQLLLLSSEPGQGSVFELTVRIEFRPESRSTSEGEPQRTGENRVDGHAQNLSGKRILIVDDVIDNRVLLDRYLKPVGMELGMASSGPEAIAMATSMPWDAILMDIQMPQMDGCEATRKLRERGFQRPIIALTAYALRDELTRCLEAGCTETLTKPVSRTDLVQKLTRILTGP